MPWTTLQARLTADRVRTWAEVFGSPLASAAAVRELAIVLRHQDCGEEAQCLMSAAASGVQATGLRTDASAAACAQMLCTLAYTPARGGHRAGALAMTEEARRAASRQPQTAPPGRLFPISPAAVDLYRSECTGHSAMPARPWKPRSPTQARGPFRDKAPSGNCRAGPDHPT
ncbi:hypothetical protein [Streptomyces sp. NBC_01261]|uniref:hypothetical protein n=1 Tax=Streptomyces sp. NBC_01261 TaxID=2903802 RepID=UPI003FCDE0E8